MTSRTGSFGSFRFALLVCALAAGACSSAFGIDDAHVDPSLSSPPANQTSTKETGKPAVCKTFDNAARLEHLLPDGGLAPLPAH